VSWPAQETGTGGTGPAEDPDGTGAVPDQVTAPDPFAATGASVLVELLAANMLVRGSLALGAFIRVSDCLNLQHGLLVLRDVEILSPRHRTLAGSAPTLTVFREHLYVVGQRQTGASSAAHPAAVIPKLRRQITFVLPGVVAHGSIHLPMDGSLVAYLESRDPAFVPMSDVEVVAASGEPIARYAFALVNREAVIAAQASESVLDPPRSSAD
jgi:hypothetical protein